MQLVQRQGHLTGPALPIDGRKEVPRREVRERAAYPGRPGGLAFVYKELNV